jgi:nucleotide-binding universal stress UspA family protein
MSRPKGSKNKKTLLNEAQLDDRIAAQKAAKRKLEAEQQKILNNIEEQKVLLKQKKKELKAADKALAALEEKKTQVDALAAATAQKAEIEKVVSSLISSGKGANEILDMLSK